MNKNYYGDREQDAHEVGIFSAIGGIGVMVLLFFGLVAGFKIMFMFVPAILIFAIYVIARQISRTNYDRRRRARNKKKECSTKL